MIIYDLLGSIYLKGEKNQIRKEKGLMFYLITDVSQFL